MGHLNLVKKAGVLLNKILRDGVLLHQHHEKLSMFFFIKLLLEFGQFLGLKLH